MIARNRVVRWVRLHGQIYCSILHIPVGYAAGRAIQEQRSGVQRAPKEGALGDAKTRFMSRLLGFIVFNPAYGTTYPSPGGVANRS